MLVYIILPAQICLLTSHPSSLLVIPMALANSLNVAEVELSVDRTS